MNREQRILSLAAIVHGAARRYPGDKDDLTQAAWVGAIHAVDTWDEQTSSLHGYAWQCCNWEIGRHLRDRNHTRSKRQLAFVALEHDDAGDDTRHLAVVDHGIETAPARIDLTRQLDTLTPRDRAIVTLLSEYSQHEIARAVGCGQATIGRVVARAREAA